MAARKLESEDDLSFTESEKIRKIIDNHLSQIHTGKVVREHLNHSDFSTLVFDVLFHSSRFWGWLLFVNLVISLLVMKFPMVAEWICSIIK